MSDLTAGLSPLSSSTLTAADDSETTVETNNLAPTVLRDVRARRRRCVCQVVKSDCIFLTRDIKHLTKEIIKVDPTASGAVRKTLQDTQIELNNIRDHLKGGLLKNLPEIKAKTETLLLTERACLARDHRHQTMPDN